MGLVLNLEGVVAKLPAVPSTVQSDAEQESRGPGLPEGRGQSRASLHFSQDSLDHLLRRDVERHLLQDDVPDVPVREGPDHPDRDGGRGHISHLETRILSPSLSSDWLDPRLHQT